MKKINIDSIYKSKTGIPPKIFDEVGFEEKQDVNLKNLFLKIGFFEFKAEILSFSWRVALVISGFTTAAVLISIHLM